MASVTTTTTRSSGRASRGVPDCRCGSAGQLRLPLELEADASQSQRPLEPGPLPWTGRCPAALQACGPYGCSLSHPSEPAAPGHRARREKLRRERPPRRRPVNPHAAANALAMQHRDIAATVAANIARRTGQPREDLEQVAMLGILQAARRYAPERGSFRPYARTYANGEVYHYLRDKGFLIKVPATWRELHARGQKLLRLGSGAAELPNLLGISAGRWEDIVRACNQRVVMLEVEESCG